MSAQNSASTPPLRLLFLGNSHTHTYDIPHMIGSLVRANGIDFPLLSRSTGEGVGFRWHWNRRETRRLIEQGGWDWIVLQGRSRDPLNDAAELSDYAGRLCELARQHSQEVLLCQTWLPKPMLSRQAEADQVYDELVQAHGIQTAKLGRAWATALGLKPDFPLYQEDEVHAAPAGAYLTACLLAMHLYQQAPANWPSRIERAGEVLADLPPFQAAWLQQLAWEVGPLSDGSDQPQ